MDPVDGELVARLVQEPLASVADLCEATGLTRNAVKARLVRLAERRVVTGFMAIPNAQLFARTGVVHVFPPGPAPDAKRLLGIEEVVSFSVNHDDVVAAITLQRDPSSPPDALVSVMGGAPARSFVQRAPPLVPAGVALSAAQWRVLAALVPDPRASTSDLAASAGVTPKVARRHREWLVKGNHILVQPILLDGVSAAGTAFFEIYAQGAADGARVQKAIGRSWIIDVLEQPRGVLVLGQSDEGAGGAVAALNRVRAVPGIEHAELIFGRDFAWAPDKLVGWCHEAAAGAR